MTHPSIEASHEVQKSAQKASATLSRLFIVGVVIQIVGGIIIGSSWPSTDYDYLTNDVVATGSGGGVAFGFFVTWAGAVSMTIALIGWGVMLGQRAALRTT